MFYDKSFMGSQCLSKVWKIANNIDESSDEDSNIPNICENLVSWIACNEEDPRRRMSLRTSSTMIHGALRLYRRKLKRLYNDVGQLDTDMIFRKKLRQTSDSSDISSEETQSTAEVDSIDHFQIESQTYTEQLDGGQSTPTDHGTPLSPIIPTRQETKLRHDKSVQVSLGNVEGTEESAEFDENLPFGYVFIHKTFNSRIPCRVLFTSLNRNVNLL